MQEPGKIEIQQKVDKFGGRYYMSTGTKGIVFDIQRCSLHDGPGIRTTVFLKGCPLRCIWCHNPESHKLEPELVIKGDKSEKMIGTEMDVDSILAEVIRDEAYYNNTGGGLTLSGGEPMLQFEFALEILKEAKKLGLHTCIETCGYASSDRYRIIAKYTDVFLYDYKETGPTKHKDFTGVSNDLILENLEVLSREGADILLRCTIIPGLNDTDEHFEGIAACAAKYPQIRAVEIMPYHNTGNCKWKWIGSISPVDHLKSADEDMKILWVNKLKEKGCKYIQTP